MKKVLFICKGNWFRSQMAAALYNKYTNSHAADSVGTYVGAPEEPEGQSLSKLFGPDSYFFKILEQNGIELRNNTTQRLEPSMLEIYDVIVSMAEEPYIPDFLRASKKVIVWDVENPPSDDRKTVEATYQKIDCLVKDLLKENCGLG
jgi:protein-tyrosine-phosphatase